MANISREPGQRSAGGNIQISGLPAPAEALRSHAGQCVCYARRPSSAGLKPLLTLRALIAGNRTPENPAGTKPRRDIAARSRLRAAWKFRPAFHRVARGAIDYGSYCFGGRTKQASRCAMNKPFSRCPRCVRFLENLRVWGNATERFIVVESFLLHLIDGASKRKALHEFHIVAPSDFCRVLVRAI